MNKESHLNNSLNQYKRLWERKKQQQQKTKKHTYKHKKKPHLIQF